MNKNCLVKNFNSKILCFKIVFLVKFYCYYYWFLIDEIFFFFFFFLNFFSWIFFFNLKSNTINPIQNQIKSNEKKKNKWSNKWSPNLFDKQNQNQNNKNKKNKQIVVQMTHPPTHPTNDTMTMTKMMFQARWTKRQPNCMRSPR